MCLFICIIHLYFLYCTENLYYVFMKANAAYQSIMLLLLFVGGLFMSCSHKQEAGSAVFDKLGVIASRQVVNGDTVVACDVSAAKESIQLPLSMLVDSLEVIRLDKKEEALVGVGWITVSDNYLGIREDHSAYKLFTRQGKFVCNVGGIGQGPGEYNLIYSSQIDEANNRIYLLPWMSQQILSYDLQGNFVENISLHYRVRKGCFHINSTKKQVTVVQLAFMGEPVAWVQDLKGNIIRENKSPQMDLEPDFSNEISIHKRYSDILNFSVFRYSPIVDSLYAYHSDTNKLVPLFTVDFGKDIPSHDLLEFSNYYIARIYGPNTDPKTLHLYTAMVIDQIIVDKQTLKGSHFKIVNDFFCGIPLKERLDEYGYVLCIEPSDLLELIEERLSADISSENRNFLKAWKNDISVDDNNYIIIGRMKK